MTKIKELGCGILTVLLITLPVWVVTTAWRGPIYAVRSLLLILGVVIAIALVSREIDRRRAGRGT
jgi:hypothetical protein